VLACWHSLRRLERLTLIGLSFTAADPHHLTAFLQAGPSSSLTSLVLGDQQGLNFLSDKALEGLGQLLGPAGKLRLLDLSGCIELTDAGEAPASKRCHMLQVLCLFSMGRQHSHGSNRATAV
jgi:hypothetical protein